MPFEETLWREAIAARARRARERGQSVEGDRFPVRTIDGGDLDFRDNGMFEDISGSTLMAFATWESTWGD